MSNYKSVSVHLLGLLALLLLLLQGTLSLSLSTLSVLVIVSSLRTSTILNGDAARS